MLGLIKDMLLVAGIYTAIAGVWKAYELIKYKKVIPRDRDTIIAVILTAVIYALIK